MIDEVDDLKAWVEDLEKEARERNDTFSWLLEAAANFRSGIISGAELALEVEEVAV